MTISLVTMAILSTTAPFFCLSGQKLFETPLQRPLSSVPKVAIVKRFNCNVNLKTDREFCFYFKTLLYIHLYY